jgi:hypothetical protein
VEAWARSSDNPVGGWYGLRKGYRGRFAMYVPPVLEALGLAEVEHNPKNNRAPAERVRTAARAGASGPRTIAVPCANDGVFAQRRIERGAKTD